MTEKNIVEKNVQVQGPPPRFCECEFVFRWHDRETRRNYRAIFDDQGGLVDGYSFREDEDEPRKVYVGLQPVVIPGVFPIIEITLIEEEEGQGR